MTTKVTIDQERFFFNGQPTYKGRYFNGWPVEGLLFNTRMVQAIFDDENQDTQQQWVYPDTGKWDPERNVQEFLDAIPLYLHHGIRAITVNLQGGMPVVATEKVQPWINTAFDARGELKSAYLSRLHRVLARADELGLAVIVGYFYFGQDQQLEDEGAVRRGTENATRWLLETGFQNILVEVNNECDAAFPDPLYRHEILRPPRVAELVDLVRSTEHEGRRLLVSTSYTPPGMCKGIPSDDVLEVSDYVLLHGNTLDQDGIRRIIEATRQKAAFQASPMPIVINEDSINVENMDAALEQYASWGYYDQGLNNYRDGFQSPPVNWTISTEVKERFFNRVAEITGESERNQRASD